MLSVTLNKNISFLLFNHPWCNKNKQAELWHFVHFVGIVCYRKLTADLKTTKIEEMKAQMEVFYQEVYRLQHSKDTGTDRGR